MSKRKGLAGFGAVAGNNEENMSTVVESNQEEAPTNKVGASDSINPAISQFYQQPEKIEKKQVSIYLDTDVIEAFNEFGKANGKGAKSDLVNNFLKQVLNIRQGG